MTEISDTISSAIAAMSLWEVLAVALGVAYLLLAMREHIWCWYAAFLGTAISIYVFWDASLLMESALNGYYMLMAVYGWYQWRHGGVASSPLPIRRWPWRYHCVAIVAVVAVAGCSGFLLAAKTDAAWPYLDSFSTWGAVLTTYMVARKVLENWLYWLVIDSVSIVLYVDRGLYLYALLFLAYLVIAVFGYLTWRRHLAGQQVSAGQQQNAEERAQAVPP